MADGSKGLMEGRKGDALGDGAARFEHIIETVKANQASTARGPAKPHSDNPFLAQAPGEEWSRRYQSTGIGPDPRGLSASDFAQVPRTTIVPERTADLVPQGFTKVAAIPSIAPLGAQIGKPQAPKRSWLGRLLRRRD